MKLILVTLSIFVLGCSATSLTSVEDQLQQMNLEIEQLKRSNEESVAFIEELKQTYDGKIRTYDEKMRRNDAKVATLEQQLRLRRTLVPQSGSVYFISFCLISFQNFRTNYLKNIYGFYLSVFSVEVPVAFSTRLHEDTSVNDSPVIFGTVDLNTGDGYDEFTGNLITNINFTFHSRGS